MTRSLPKDVVNLHIEFGAPYKSLSCQLVLHNIQSITACALFQLQDPRAQAIARRSLLEMGERKAVNENGFRCKTWELLGSCWRIYGVVRERGSCFMG